MLSKSRVCNHFKIVMAPFLGTEKVPRRNCVTKILPNVRVNFLVRFASKSWLYWVMASNLLEVFRKFFGAVGAIFCGFVGTFWLLPFSVVLGKSRFLNCRRIRPNHHFHHSFGKKCMIGSSGAYKPQIVHKSRSKTSVTFLAGHGKICPPHG